jgi:hypothetical protein
MTENGAAAVFSIAPPSLAFRNSVPTRVYTGQLPHDQSGSDFPNAVSGAGERPHVFYQSPKRESWMVIPRAESSPSNPVTAADISPSPGTTTAHSKFSRNSRETICH